LKTVPLESEGLSLEGLLQEASRGEVVFLTADGQTRFALIPADDGDREVASLRSNAEFMAYLTASAERARTGPRKTLREIRQLDAAEAEPPSATDR
jgi:antitoxin (DNA-binding transcriptional repressor) of toxin-antitoxin stability system